MDRRVFNSRSPEETIRWGRKLGAELAGREHIFLRGDIGSGKTVLAKGICLGLGVEDTHIVTSPTFTLVHEYNGRYPVYHLDLFRLQHTRDLESIGFDEIYEAEGIVMIEWPEMLEGIYHPDIDIEIFYEGECARRIVAAFRETVRGDH